MQTRLDFIIGNLVQALQLIAKDPQKVFSSLNLMTSDELNYQSTEWARSAAGDLPTEKCYP